MFADGTYDALVVDASPVDGAILLSLVISAGAHKGEVVDVRARHLQHDALELLAVPCILVVRSGEPSVVFD